MMMMMMVDMMVKMMVKSHTAHLRKVRQFWPCQSLGSSLIQSNLENYNHDDDNFVEDLK